MSSSADTLSAWVSGELKTIASCVENSARLQRFLFSPLTYSISSNKFTSLKRPAVNYREFESAHVWVFRGKEKMEEDLQRFMGDVAKGLVGYLQAATGLGKSTKIVRDIAARIHGKVLVISPEERLVSLTWSYVSGKEAKQGGKVNVTRLTGHRSNSSMEGDLIYMTAATLLMSILVSESFLDDNQVDIIYIDEAHTKSAEYDVLRCLSMLNFFGSRTVVFSTATPPNLASQEAFREVEPVVNEFDFVDVKVSVSEAAIGTPFHYKAVKGRVLIFAVDDWHASRLFEYYMEHDIEVLLLNTSARTKDWATLRERFSGNPGSTSVVVTSFVLETGYNYCFTTVIDFSARPAIVNNREKSCLSMSIRPIDAALASQRAGRAGRMGGSCNVFRMRSPMYNGPNDTSSVVSEIQWFCWMQLFSIRSNQKVFERTARLVGNLSLQKIRHLLSTSLHPLLLLRYLDDDGYVKRPFVNGLKVFFPAHYDFGATVDVSYSEAVRGFESFKTRHSNRTARIPMSAENYFLGDMLAIDAIASSDNVMADDLLSFAGDAVLTKDDVAPRVEEAYDVKMLYDVMGRNERADSVLEAEAALEGFPALRNREDTERTAMIAAVRDFTESSPIIPDLDVNWTEYPNLQYTSVRSGNAEIVPQFARQARSIAPSMGFTPSTRPLSNLLNTGEAAQRRRSSRVDREVVQVPRYQPPAVVERPVFPSRVSEPETIWPTVKASTVREEPVRRQVETGHRELNKVQTASYAGSVSSGAFHPSYGQVVQMPIMPKLVVKRSAPTFLATGVPVSPEEHSEEMLYPYKAVPANLEKYTKPSESDLVEVTLFVSGRERVSNLRNSEREKLFVSLLKVWNANVVDNLQYSGRSQHTRHYSETHSSRNTGTNKKKEVKVYKGSRYSTEELVAVFDALEVFGLIPCVVSRLQPHSSTVVESTWRGDLRIQQVLSRKDAAMRVDRVSMLRVLKCLGIGGFMDGCDLFLSGNAWEYVWTKVCPNVHVVTRLGYVLGGALSLGGMKYTLGHVLGRELENCDLVSLGPSKAKPEDEPERAVAVCGDYCFVVLANPGCVAGISIELEDQVMKLCGPLRIVGRHDSGFISCEGDSVKGMSGATVVSATTGRVVGLLYGIDSESKRVLVTEI